MKSLRVIFFTILFLLLFNITPAYADGGIPLWIYTAESAYSSVAVRGLESSSFALGTIFLLCVIFVEIVVLFFVDKNKSLTFKEKFYSVILANIFSTIAGVIFTLPILYNVPTDIFVGPGLLIFPMHVVCFVLSYFVELYTYKLLFSKKLEPKVIRKIALWTNIWTYFILNPLTIFFVIIALVSLFTYLSAYLSDILTYKKFENVSSLKTPIIINEVKIISPYFKPNKIGFMKCQELQKRGYPITDCKYETSKGSYWIWIDAVRQCEDINGRLPNNKELAHIAEFVYKQPLGSFAPLHKTDSGLKYDSSSAIKANLPSNADYYLISNEFTGPYGEPDYRIYNNYYTGGHANLSIQRREVYAICVSK